MVDFSFIIPVYNAGKTIQRCLDSILAQHHNNYEVIIVDDGSSDNSYEICRKYQMLDRRFRVYHQQNSGPSVARNKGLDIAQGEWICFVDSDDAIQANYLEKLKLKIIEENPEVVFMGYRKININNGKIEIKLPGHSEKNYYENLVKLSSMDMYGYTWIKCFKRSSIGDKRFNVDLTLFEDEIFSCQVLKDCKHLCYLNDALYDYYTGLDEALTQRTHQDYCEKCNYVFLAWENLIEPYDLASSFLKNKAHTFVEQCRYYGLERPVKIKEFYSDLAYTRYFELCTHENKFERYVLNRNYVMLRLMKVTYNLKIKVVKMLKH